jgi:hypothetical protein
MTKKEILLWLVLADFVALTGYTIASEGYTTFVPVAWAFATSSAWGLQIVVDFLLAVSIGLGFVFFDARRRQLATWPFVALTLTLGSIGLLGYLIYRERVAFPARNLEAAPQHA